MKLYLLFSLSLAFTLNATEPSVGLPTDGIRLVPIAGKISLYDSLEQSTGTLLSVNFALNGCSDQLAAIQHTVVNSTAGTTGISTVVISAWSVERKLSVITTCVSKPIITKTLRLRDVTPPLKVIYLGTNITEDLPWQDH